MKDLEKIDQLFRNAVAAETTLDSNIDSTAMWNRLDRGLENKKPKAVGYQWMGFAAAACLLAAIFIQIFNAENSEKLVVKVTKVKQETNVEKRSFNSVLVEQKAKEPPNSSKIKLAKSGIEKRKKIDIQSIDKKQFEIVSANKIQLKNIEAPAYVTLFPPEESKKLRLVHINELRSRATTHFEEPKTFFVRINPQDESIEPVGLRLIKNPIHFTYIENPTVNN